MASLLWWPPERGYVESLLGTWLAEAIVSLRLPRPKPQYLWRPRSGCHAHSRLLLDTLKSQDPGGNTLVCLHSYVYFVGRTRVAFPFPGLR